MTGSYELCMLIDGVVKRYPTAIVDLDTPYYTGMVKVLCMDTPGHNMPGARGPDTDTKPQDVEYTSQCITDTPQCITDTLFSADKQSGETVPETDKTLENGGSKSDVVIEECAAVQTRAMVANEKKPPKPLKVNSVPGWDVLGLGR